MSLIRASHAENSLENPQIYNSHDLINELQARFKTYDVNSPNAYMWLLLQLALQDNDEITREVNDCRKFQIDDNYFILAYPLSRFYANIFVTNIKEKFKDSVCELDSYNDKYQLWLIKFSFNLIHKNKLLSSVDELFKLDKNLIAYRRYSSSKQPTSLHNENFLILAKYLREHGLDIQKCDIVELIILRMFGYREQFEPSSMTSGLGFIGKMLETRLIINIPATAIENLIQAINDSFPGHHCTSSTPVNMTGQAGEKMYPAIRFDSALVLDAKFMQLFQKTLAKVALEEPALIQQYQAKSQLLINSVESDCLELLSKECQTSTNENMLALGTALSEFATVGKNPNALFSSQKQASEGVRKVIAAVEAKQTSEENILFKKGMKKDIKSLQTKFRNN